MSIRFISAFSIDVALGCVIFSNSIAHSLGYACSLIDSVLLFNAVWIIYTLDHLVDAHITEKSSLAMRHLLHHRFKSEVLIVLTFVCLISLILLFFTSFKVLFYGSLVLVLILSYLYLNFKYKLRIKELIVALGYSIGVFFSTAMSPPFEMSPEVFQLFAQTLLLAFINLVVFSIYEKGYDEASGFSSLSTLYAHQKVKNSIVILFVLYFSIAISGILYFDKPVIILMQLIFIVMGVLLFVVFIKRNVWQNSLKYRIIGDNIFHISGLIFLFN